MKVGSTTVASFVYAPDGSRLKKITPSGTTLYLGADIENAAGGWVKYPHPDAVRVGTGTGAATTWLTRDHSQSTSSITCGDTRLRLTGTLRRTA